MNAMEEKVSSLASEVEQLRNALGGVTEALILFQEFIEAEIGEMAYFRDSGSYYNLVDILDGLRRKTMKVSAIPLMNVQAFSSHQLQQDSEAGFDTGDDMRMTLHAADNLKNKVLMSKVLEDDEEVEVEVDLNEDEGEDAIMIDRVFSVSVSPLHSSDIKVVAPGKINLAENKVKFLLGQETPLVPAAVGGIRKGHKQVQQNTSKKIVSSSAVPLIHFSPVENPRLIPAIKAKVVTKEVIPCTPPSVPPQQRSSSRPHKPKKNQGSKSAQQLSPKLKKKAKATKTLGKSDKAKPKAGLVVNKQDESQARPCERPINCPVCFKSYSSRGVMSRHIKEAHQVEPQFRCFYCPIMFRNGPMRLEHMNAAHPEDMNSMVCPYCSRTSGSVAGKRNHMMLCQRKHANSQLPKCALAKTTAKN